ncbi:MAG: hypothetical protein A3E80_05605 [Chlamydiae bacterium RIFCSPHIGHO2_12_FULL_49_9]|nr:MAG: hypothetical protein A3E80_05605 [Chlamydiae bacterium RIFCSPHIGHO2_12_FULL_49_9]
MRKRNRKTLARRRRCYNFQLLKFKQKRDTPPFFEDFMKWVVFLFLMRAFSLSASYKTEGFWSFYDNEKRLFLISTFLPSHPAILALSQSPEIYDLCRKQWPQGSLFYLDTLPCERCHEFDLIWLKGSGFELETLVEATDLVSNARLVYTTTDLAEGRFSQLKTHLEYVGFRLISHWYEEEKRGNALFLRNDFYEATMRTHAYEPREVGPLILGPPLEMSSWVKVVLDKDDSHRIEGIDFIYMINLDERPEKFARSAGELQFYGISPYRFSAVNGWKLPTAVFDEVGVKFAPGSLRERFIGSTYLEEGGKEYIHTEFLQENGAAYFTRYLARGAIGIVLSHLSVLKDAYDAGYETIWVMEDDIEVIEDPRKIPKLLKDLDRLAPDWDIFFTDIDTKSTVGEHVPCRALAARPNVSIPPLSAFLEKFYPIGENFYRMGMRYGAYSMILRRGAIKKILDYYRNFRVFIPYDMDYWLCPNLTMYYYNQDIVSHRAGAPSDNNEPRYQRGSPW